MTRLLLALAAVAGILAPACAQDTVRINNATKAVISPVPFRVGQSAVDPTSPGNGALWYDTANNTFDIQINGATLSLSASGVGMATDTLWDAAGDLAVGTGPNTGGRLAKGTALQILRVNAGATALEWSAPSTGAPFDDANALVKGSVDPTKLLRFEIDGFTTATTRVITVPNIVGDQTMALQEGGNQWTAENTFTGAFTIDGSEDVNISPSGGALVSINPLGTVGSINRMNIGDAVPGTAAFTTLTATTYNALPVEICLALSDETTAITTGTAKVTFRAPYAFTVTAVRANVNTVSSSGLPTVDINETGTTILSTKLSIDASEKTSLTATAAAVISDAAIADDAEITLDIDVAGTGAKGLKVWILGTR